MRANSGIIDTDVTTIIGSAGLVPPSEIIPDGSIHRFSSNGNNGDRAGYYCIYDNGGGFFGCWRADIYQTIKPQGHDSWSYDQKENYRNKIAKAKEEADAQRKIEREQAAEEAQKIWDVAPPAPENHAYLSKKQVKPHNCRISKGRLVIPVMDHRYKIISLQFIKYSGEKKFLPRGKTKGGFCVIGNDDFHDGGFICEGWATGASIHEATGKPVIVAFNSNNLPTVAELFKDQPLIICADNDLVTAEKRDQNPGVNAAKLAAEKSGLPFVICPVDSDFNDFHVKEGLSAVNKSIEYQRPKTFQEYHEIIDSKDSELDAEFLTGDLAISIKEAALPAPLKDQLLKKIAKKCNIRVQLLRNQQNQQPRDGVDNHSQIGMVVDLVDEIGRGNILFSHESVWKWDDKGVWIRIDDRQIKAWLQEKLKNSGGEITQNIINSMLDLFKTEIHRPNHQFDLNRDTINCLSGELHWNGDNWELKKHCRESYRTTQIPVVYDPSAKAPIFEGFLLEIFETDDDKTDKAILCLEMFGNSLLSSTNYEKFFMLVGRGANGKSVLLSVLIELLGVENVSAVMPNQLDNKFQRAHLHGKNANIITELPEGTMLPDAAIKSIASGERMTAEHKFKPPFEFTPFATLIFATNHLPHSRDFSDALFRRAIIIPFNRVFPEKEQDRNLAKKLKKELPGVLNLALKALAGVLQRGYFTETESVNDLRNQWRLESDQAAQFIEECCSYGKGYKESSRDLYNAYLRWAENSGVNKSLSQNSFTKRLMLLGGTTTRGTGGRREIAGFRLRQDT